MAKKVGDELEMNLKQTARPAKRLNRNGAD